MMVKLTARGAMTKPLQEKRNVPQSWQGVYYISDYMIETVVSTFAVTIAAGLLIGGIAALDSAQARNYGWAYSPPSLWHLLRLWDCLRQRNAPRYSLSLLHTRPCWYSMSVRPRN